MPGSGQGLAGRTVVITGGAGGIGRAVGAGFAAAQCRVVLADLVEAGEQWADNRALDVTDPAGVADLMTQVAQQYGGPHILVTLAGGSLGTPRDLDQVTQDHLDLVLDVNVKGTFMCCQAVAPLMANAGGGAIVTCSSIGGRQPSPVTGAPYAAAKAAIGGLTRRLARELGPAGIRVNSVAPGLFLTPRLAERFDQMPQTEQREVLDAIPLGRMPELREIVEPILFLASDASSFITGITLDVNGGRYLPP